MFNKGHRCRSQSGVAEEIVKNIARNNFIRNLISRLSFSASWVKKKKKRKLSVFLVFTHRNGGTVPLCLLEYYNRLLKYS